MTVSKAFYSLALIACLAFIVHLMRPILKRIVELVRGQAKPLGTGPETPPYTMAERVLLLIPLSAIVIGASLGLLGIVIGIFDHGKP